MRPIFIGGCPRSGTTLLGALIGAHSRCLCVPEMQFHWDLRREIGRSGGRIGVEELTRRLARHWRWRIWETPLDPKRFWGAWDEPPEDARRDGSVTYEEAVEGVIRVYASEVGQPVPAVWVDHTPGNIRRGNVLLDRFPEARMVHLVRDGRSVAGSVVPLSWGPNTVWELTDWWPQWLAFGLALEEHEPSRVTRVRFEDLVRDPVDVLRRLCPALGLPWEEGLGQTTEFRLPGFNRAQHRLVARAPDASRAQGWKEELTAREVEVFESSAGDLLRSLGYELEYGGDARRPTRAELWRFALVGGARREYNRVRLAWRKRRMTSSG